LYAEIWFLEQVAIKTGIRQDLNAVFDGTRELVDDLITLAMFPYLTRFTYNRVARWQRTFKSPSSRELTTAVITRLTQSITERHRVELFKLCAARLKNGELCAIDSTTGPHVERASPTCAGAITKTACHWSRPLWSSCTRFPAICQSFIERFQATFRIPEA
jgi:hypothetical protein